MDYRKAYCHLFNAVTDCIALLQKAQLETEEMTAASEAIRLRLLHKPDSSPGRK